MNDDTAPRLAGKRVLISGTGRGQGAAAQELFCHHGATVIGCDAIAGAAEATAERLRDVGLSAEGSTVDLADPADAQSWVEDGVGSMGGLDVLYNNAGAPRFASFAELSLEDWRFTIVNELDILFHVTSPAWRFLVDGGGSVINTASVSGELGSTMVGAAAHAAAKGGVLGFSRQLAIEGAPDQVRVNAISPGFIETPGTAVVPADIKKEMIAETSLGRAGTPQDIARYALYLASDESTFVTGTEMFVDGGYSAH